MIQVIENFLADPVAERAKALAASYSDVDHNGLDYKNIHLHHDEAAENKIRLAVGCAGGAFETFYRFYKGGETHSTWIHCDVEIGHHSAVLFLNEPANCRGGLAFWRHKTYGWHRQPTAAELVAMGIRDTKEFWQGIHQDGLDPFKWEMVEYVPMEFNRLVIFDSSLFHSRYPKETSGEGVENGRLIKTFFFVRPDRALKAI